MSIRVDTQAPALEPAALARQLWRLAWPAAAHMLLVTFVFVVSRILLGHAGEIALASMQVSGTLLWTIESIFTAFSVGTLAVVARAVGAGDRAAATRAARASLLFAFGVGIAVTAGLLAGERHVLSALFPGTDEAVLREARAYLDIVLPVMPLGFVEVIAAACLQASGDTRTPLAVATAGNVVNVAIGAVLIFGAFGLPALGVRGAAVGAAAAVTIDATLLVALLASGRASIGLRGSLPSGEGHELRRVLRVSVPAFADKLVYHAGYVGYVAIIGMLGSAAMAANQALVSIEAVCFLSAEGFGIAASSLAAQKLGACEPRTAARVALLGCAMAIAVLGGFGVLFAVAPRALLAAFSSEPDLVSAGQRALYVAAVAQPFMAFAIVMAAVLRSAGDTRTALIVTAVCAFAVRLAASWFFAIDLRLGLVGIWMGSTSDWIARTLLLGAAFARGRWRTVRV